MVDISSMRYKEKYTPIYNSRVSMLLLAQENQISIIHSIIPLWYRVISMLIDYVVFMKYAINHIE